MTGDTLNGAKIIIEEMEEELEIKTLPRRDRMYLKSNIYMLKLLSSLRGDVEVLKKHDLIGMTITYPKAAAWLFGASILIYSAIDPTAMKLIFFTVFKMVTGVDLN